MLTYTPLMAPDVLSPAARDDTGLLADRLLRIQEAAAETGLTPRSIRYYEELGLLSPAARSDGAYRLYDADDLERLRFIRGLRDDAGFSLAEIGQLLGDEQARARNRALFAAAQSNEERRPIVQDALERVDRQVATLEHKIERLQAMINDARSRRAHLQDHLDDIDAGREPAHRHSGPTHRRGDPG
jgi:MerR family transcriptional regulator, repressor of the yfmOP operon